MAKDNIIKIGGELKSVAADGVVAGAEAIRDYTEGKAQSAINAELRAAIAAINQFVYVIAPALPLPSASTMYKIYLIPASDSADNNVKDEYITIESSGSYSWEKIGSTSVDLSAYSTTAQMNTAIQNAVSGKQDTINDLAAIRSGASAGATAVQPAAMNTALAGKQDTISDIATIRSGATAGATAYQKPSTGIPKTDMASAVQASLSKADTALQEHQSLANYYTKSQVDNLIVPVNTDVVIVDTLPASGTANTIYRVPGTDSYTDNGWDGTQWVTLATYNTAYDAGGALN